MKTVKYPVKSADVLSLCEMLYKLGYSITISDLFSTEIDAAVKDFQMKNFLVVDGIVGIKTWQLLFEKNAEILDINSKFLSEYDLIEFAQKYNIELATIKAVNEIESSGKGFLINGKPKILFEGHVFWKELKKRGINPENYSNAANQNVLYSKWNKMYYQGGVREYDRLNQAIHIGPDPTITEAAFCAASWGCFQIMGFHAVNLGYGSVANFVDKMNISEKEHLFAFGKFLEVNNLIRFLLNKSWASFAKYYNGSDYESNNYDKKLQRAYLKYAQ